MFNLIAKEVKDPTKLLESFSLPKLRKIVNDAVTNLRISPTWAKLPNNVPEAVEHINEMCNEFNCRVYEDGSIRKATNIANP